MKCINFQRGASENGTLFYLINSSGLYEMTTIIDKILFTAPVSVISQAKTISVRRNNDDELV
jgi:hypothetical protein